MAGVSVQRPRCLGICESGVRTDERVQELGSIGSISGLRLSALGNRKPCQCKKASVGSNKSTWRVTGNKQVA